MIRRFLRYRISKRSSDSAGDDRRLLVVSTDIICPIGTFRRNGPATILFQRSIIELNRFVAIDDLLVHANVLLTQTPMRCDSTTTSIAMPRCSTMMATGEASCARARK